MQLFVYIILGVSNLRSESHGIYVTCGGNGVMVVALVSLSPGCVTPHTGLYNLPIIIYYVMYRVLEQ